MTVYVPNYTLARNGEDQLDVAINDVSITFGRQDVQDQPYPSSMTFTCYSIVGTDLNFLLDDQVEFFIDNIRQMVGYVTTVSISMTPGTAGNNIALYSITCAGPLAFLSRTSANGFSSDPQVEITLMDLLLNRAFSLLWTDLGSPGVPSLTWAQYDQTITWADTQIFPFATAPVIEGSSQYYLSAIVNSTENMLTLCQSVAQSSRGILYDSRDGAITFDSYNWRQTPTQTITVTADEVLTESITTSMSMGDLVNIVNIEYTGDDPGTAQATNVPSIDLYGPRAATKSTTLYDATEAQNQAADYVVARALPDYFIQSFTVPLHSNDIDTLQRDAYLSLSLDNAVIWPDALLPTPISQSAEVTNFVEGWTLVANQNEIYLTINQSPRSYTYGHKMWLEIPTSRTWLLQDPAIQWKDI